MTEYTEKKGTSTRVKTSCTYDTYYRPTTSTYTMNGKSYSYSCGYANSLGDELSSFTTPLGVVTYTRDDLKRLKSQRYTCKNVSALQSYTYAPNRADGTYTSQLVKNLNFTVGSNVQRLSYTYDASGNITAIEDNAGAVASYEYDGLGRLTRENIAGKKTVEYHYDSAGNLTSKKEYAYTTGNLGAIKATHSYQYASGTWGDRLAFYDGACITYNAAGYPTCYRGNALTWSNGNLTKYGNLTFAYNDAGIRIKKGTTEYIVKDDLILAEKRGDTVIHYYYDDSGVAGFEYNGQKYFYRKNLQGDIIGIYDSCWNLLGQYEYDAWGNLLSQIGSEILKINPFRYRGYYCDTESGIYYLNSRYYDPVIGRFISPDSLSYLEPETCNGLNLYAYCLNDPVNCIDISGAYTISNSLGIDICSSIMEAGIGVGLWIAAWAVKTGARPKNIGVGIFRQQQSNMLTKLNKYSKWLSKASTFLTVVSIGVSVFEDIQSDIEKGYPADRVFSNAVTNVAVYSCSALISGSSAALAGSLIGRVVGSLLPGVGNVIGAVVGFAVGFAISLLLDMEVGDKKLIDHIRDGVYDFWLMLFGRSVTE